jgi:hypothetical protein
MRQMGDEGPPLTGFVIKPVEGLKGHGVHVFEKRAPGDAESFLTLDGRQMAADDIYFATAGSSEVQKLGRQIHTRSFLVEERLRPQWELEELIGPTLCTVRIITFIARDGSPQILGAILRMQSDRSGVDHTSRGSVGAWINVHNGVLGPGRAQYSREIIKTIPGTDRQYVGFLVPFWEEVRSVAETAQLAFPWARSIGWDVGVTDRGPFLIEGNEWWSMTSIQRSAPQGLMKGDFKALFEALNERH